jgi:hypothetical protein
LVGAVDLGGARRDLGLREIVHGFAQCVDVFAELKIQSGEGHGLSPGALVARFSA